MLKFGDRARQTTTTTGTGTISLDGAAPAGWFSFAESGLVTGRTCHYLVELPNGQDFAVIEGTLTVGSPSTLTRARVLRSKIGGVAGTTNPSLTGTSTVTCVWTAEDADNANPVLGTPSISAGTLVIDLDKNAESAHRITLNQNVNAGGISFTNPPSGYCKVYIEFNQATPSGTKYDVPITAWTGGPGTVTFDTDYAVYQDATPTVVWLTSTDGMATARARMNTELIAYLTPATKLDDLAAPDDNADLNATTLRHGLLPKLGGGTTNYLRADGTWAQPAGGGGGGASSGLVIAEASTLGGAMSCYFVEASTLG